MLDNLLHKLVTFVMSCAAATTVLLAGSGGSLPWLASQYAGNPAYVMAVGVCAVAAGAVAVWILNDSP